MKRLAAIGFIWLCCAVAWGILGSTILVRSGESSGALTYEVHRLWGSPAVQSAPGAVYHEKVKVKETTTVWDPKGQPVPMVVEKEEVRTYPVSLEKSDLTVSLALEHRRKGLMWFPTYEVDFRGLYVFKNPTGVERNAEVTFPFSSNDGVFDGFAVLDAKGTPVETEIGNGNATWWTGRLAPGETRAYTVKYRSRGTSSWSYHPTRGTGQIRDFSLAMTTDFEKIDFPAGTISPSQHAAANGAWNGSWKFDTLVASAPIGVMLPERLNPGPLASRITFFAPVGLLFFFFVVAVFGAAKGREIHPLNYFFLACAFFAFHLLFAYLVDHLSIPISFATASAVSVLLVVSYARLFVGWKFAVREMAISQLLYLVLFSWTFFWSGFTGLAITIGAILTLFVMMQFTGRVKWGLQDLKGQVSPVS